MKSNDTDWKRIHQFRREQQKKIALMQEPAPFLISQNANILRLARQLDDEAEAEKGSANESDSYLVY